MITKERVCPICNSLKNSKEYKKENIKLEQIDAYSYASRKMPEYMHYRLEHCANCDLVYANPVPVESEIFNAYSEADYDSSEEADLASKSYGNVLDSFINHLPDKMGAVDIGTGNGSFLNELIDRKFSNILGFEPSMAPIKAAKKEIQSLIVNDIFTTDALTPDSLSLVSCFQTIEHVPEPAEMVKAVYDILKPGGAIFIVSHNYRAFSTKVLGSKSPIFDIEHLQLFSPRSGEQLLKSCGFKNIEIKKIVNSYPVRYWLKIFPVPKPIKIKLLKSKLFGRIAEKKLSFKAGNIAIIGYK